MIKRILSVALSLLLIVSVVFTSSASEVDDAKNELKQTQKEINDLKNQKKEAQQNLLKDKEYQESIIADLQQKGYEKSQIEAKIKDIEAAIETLNVAIAQAQSEYEAQLKLFQERIVILYIQARTNANAEEIFQSSSYEEMFKKVHMLQLISKYDQDLMASLEKKRLEIEDLKAIKENEEMNAAQQLEESLKAINELEVSRSQATDRVEQSKQSLAQIEKAEDQLEKEAKELSTLINKLSSKGSYSGGIMQWPTPGYYKISSAFGYRIHPILKYRKFHGGIDINAPSKAYIHAAASGKVIWSGWRSGGSGNTVIIDHGGGITTLYLHIINGGLLVKEGQSVKAGDVIAKVGSTGLSTGPHLHFEVRKNGERQDPLKYVSNKN